MRTTREWADTTESYSEAVRAVHNAHYYASGLLRHVHSCAVLHKDPSFPNDHKVADLQIVLALGVAMANSAWKAASTAGAELENMGAPTDAFVERSVEDIQYTSSLEPVPLDDIVQSIKRDIGDVEEDYDCGVGLTVIAIAVELDTARGHAEPQMLNSADESVRDCYERFGNGVFGILKNRESGYERAFRHALIDLERFNQSSQPHHEGVCPARVVPQ